MTSQPWPRFLFLFIYFFTAQSLFQKIGYSIVLVFRDFWKSYRLCDLKDISYIFECWRCKLNMSVGYLFTVSFDCLQMVIAFLGFFFVLLSLSVQMFLSELRVQFYISD